MKKLFVSDLKKKTIKDLIKLRNKLRRELFDNNLKNTLRSLSQTHLITVGKRNIARINTAVTQKVKEAA